MTEYETLEAFARAVHERLPDEWDTQFEPAHDVDEFFAAFRRDDLTGFIIRFGTNESWPPDEFQAVIPHESGCNLPDRPGKGTTYSIDASDVDATVETILDNLPEYEGTFEYDDE